MKMLAARIGPTVCELLGPTIVYFTTSISFALFPFFSSYWNAKRGENAPPILKRSKVEMTACSGRDLSSGWSSGFPCLVSTRSASRGEEECKFRVGVDNDGEICRTEDG